jgi:hypothetical protein
MIFRAPQHDGKDSDIDVRTRIDINQRPCVYTYTVKFDVQRNTVLYLAALLRAERRRRGTRRVPGVSALLGRHYSSWPGSATDPTWSDWMRASAWRSTAYRYLDEGITVLAAKARTLADALECAKAQKLPYLIPGGKTVTRNPGNSLGRPPCRWYAPTARPSGCDLRRANQVTTA